MGCDYYIIKYLNVKTPSEEKNINYESRACYDYIPSDEDFENGGKPPRDIPPPRVLMHEGEWCIPSEEARSYYRSIIVQNTSEEFFQEVQEILRGQYASPAF